jgi:protein-S-isoprenylcysteine O-methyltransferase Ste14
MMIEIGSFFFKYRNWVFIPMYLALFMPSPELLSGERRYWLILIGMFVSISGQVIRCATIGLAYIERGGKDKKVYASRLVTEGIFNHCRNPLYIGNILKLVGIGILSNSLLYIALFIPVFLFIFQAIVLAEENFLSSKFGTEFDAYCQRTNRWIPRFSGIIATFNGMTFMWKRILLRENSTLYVWFIGIVLVLLIKYPELTSNNALFRNQLLVILLALLTTIFLGVRYLKKSGKLKSL